MRVERHSDAACISLLAAIWVAAALAVGPVGNFPLNDDWAYASAVRSMVEHGELRLSGWTATNLIAQVLWGALFCLPFGFSFTALRISTLLLAVLGVLGTYALLREARAKPGTALIGALTLAFNPIYFALSFTFMTDVPFTAVSIGSSWLLLRGLRQRRRAELVAGLGLAITAILIRQIGLAIPIAFASAFIAKRGLGFRRLVQAIVPVVAGLVIQTAYQVSLRWLGRVPATFGAQIATIRTQVSLPWATIADDAAIITFYALVYTGFLLLPFLIIVRPADSLARARKIYLGAFGAAAVLTMILAAHGNIMPLYGNVLGKGGIGWDMAPSPALFRLLLTFLACFGAFLLVAGLIRGGLEAFRPTRAGCEAREPHVLAFALAAIATAFGPLPLLGLGGHGFYDRYLILFLPWIMLALVTVAAGGAGYRQSRIAVLTGFAGLVFIAAFSIAATHDYLAFNRTRWVALEDTMQRYHVGPDRVDGGFEFNGWYLYNANYVIKPDKSWYWVVDDEYVVQRSPRPGYETLVQYPVNWWLPWAVGRLIVQHKITGPDQSLTPRNPKRSG